jgi:hypothetical protein
VNSGQFIQWQDLFVLIDNGTIPIARYGPIETMIREQGEAHPKKCAFLVILPADTKPPPDDVKRWVKSTLMRLAPSLSCITYLIEGTGFKGITVRATLVGMKIFSLRPYPIYVETSLHDALVKMTSHMVNANMASVEAIKKAITDARMAWNAPASARSRDGEMP